MKPGDCFLFGGRLLELVRVHQMTAYVKKRGRRAAARCRAGTAAACRCRTRWPTRCCASWTPPTTACSTAPRCSACGRCWRSSAPGRRCRRPPRCVAETWKSREGWHLFLYPFAGRQVHLGLASLLAWRAAQPDQATFSIAINDYGLELLSARADRLGRTPARAAGDAGRPARAAGRGAGQPQRHRAVAPALPRDRAHRRADLPVASGRAPVEPAAAGVGRPVLRRVPEIRPRQPAAGAGRERAAEPGAGRARSWRRRCGACTAQRCAWSTLARPSPFAFPLMVERFREKLTNESLSDRIARMVADLEGRAGGERGGHGARGRDSRCSRGRRCRRRRRTRSRSIATQPQRHRRAAPIARGRGRAHDAARRAVARRSAAEALWLLPESRGLARGVAHAVHRRPAPGQVRHVPRARAAGAVGHDAGQPAAARRAGAGARRGARRVPRRPAALARTRNAPSAIEPLRDVARGARGAALRAGARQPRLARGRPAARRWASRSSTSPGPCRARRRWSAAIIRSAWRGGTVLAGHWHPAVTLRGPARDHQRLAVLLPRSTACWCCPPSARSPAAARRRRRRGRRAIRSAAGACWPGLRID